MRQVVLDTETTGIGHENGHRIIEIGCVELINRKPHRHFHCYLNPQRNVDDGAFRVHGISTEFLQDKPLFQDIVHDFMDFIKGAELIIHNAAFDLGFINAELKRIGYPNLVQELCSVCDTLSMAKEKHPGQRNNLDALCKRYDIDNSNRTLHGALLDAEILAFVYLAMTGGQADLFSEKEDSSENKVKQEECRSVVLNNNTPVLAASALELEEHEKFVQFLQEKSTTNLWAED